MCLTIPKKVLSVKKNIAVVKNPLGKKQELKSIIKVRKGDYVLSQQNVIIQKIGKRQAEELLGLLKGK
ncbi:MAG: hypothetical protein A3J63_04970 [Candidatus Moranbacteria bacterium RIFCSPHIGHO2_02_FULL_40_12b]|nr:MAG: hypothetical protein A3J63_04970 [Candidatus Moranbacteria bacterium RIFCSPHIGHO2_02_FULL_40_12b]OGI23736.1 MAG: hypothetical protein A3E91_02080 [Candidatus Moranbacteria bacterium RIFCSPHIGHO2_12_FULL_40_10]